MTENQKEINLPSGKVQPRSANHPECKHEWRFLRMLTPEHPQFYCIHCLLYTVKVNDVSLSKQKEQILQMQKEYDELRIKRKNEEKNH